MTTHRALPKISCHPSLSKEELRRLEITQVRVPPRWRHPERAKGDGDAGKDRPGAASPRWS